MPTISFSQWKTWKSCGHHWKLKYVIGPRIDDTSIDTMFGKVMHSVIQEWLTDIFALPEDHTDLEDRSERIKSGLISGFSEATILAENNQPVYLCDKPTLIEYFNQGVLIMEYLQTYRKKIFPTKDVVLKGIETELKWKLKPNVWFTGFIDIVTENTKTGYITLYDLKTSNRGWNDYAKKDVTKTAQLLLYKRIYSKQFKVPEALIEVEYLILKRNISESADYHIPRVSKFVPAHGTPSVNKAYNLIVEFVDQCFAEDGSYDVSTIEPQPSKSNCRFCPYRNDKLKCPVGVN